MRDPYASDNVTMWSTARLETKSVNQRGLYASLNGVLDNAGAVLQLYLTPLGTTNMLGSC
jgi:hypothetical protein